MNSLEVTRAPDLVELLEIFKEVKLLLNLPDADFTWSTWENKNDASWEIPEIIMFLERGILPDVSLMTVLFLPTGDLQEMSLDSGWPEKYMELAARFDAAIGGRC